MNKIETLKEQITGLTEHLGLFDEYLFQAKKLKIRQETFIVSDLDDTLFSRVEQLEKEPELVLRRGYVGNTYLINEIGISPMLKKYYVNKNYPQEIIQKLNPKKSLILTAGIYEYQMGKQKALGLTDYPIQIVHTGKDKILELIRYILYTLKYIPSEIEIYEDRPEFFIEYRDFIESCLGTKLHIHHVEMDGNSGYKKIETV